MNVDISVRRIADRFPISADERMQFRRSAYFLLLQTVRSRYSDIKEEMEEGIRPFEKDQSGKPYLPGHPEAVFNLSHSRNGYAAAAAADPSEARAVGIDIERRFPYRESLARKICHEEEWNLLQCAVTEEKKRDLLNLIWSRKEAVLKCDGIGIRVPLRKVNTFRLDAQRYWLVQRQTEEYTLVVCCRRADCF